MRPGVPSSLTAPLGAVFRFALVERDPSLPSFGVPSLISSSFLDHNLKAYIHVWRMPVSREH